MDSKHAVKKSSIQPRDLGQVEAEEATEVMHEAASVDDRIVTRPESEEKKPKTIKKEGIVSVNGEDVDKTEVEIEKDRAA